MEELITGRRFFLDSTGTGFEVARTQVMTNVVQCNLFQGSKKWGPAKRILGWDGSTLKPVRAHNLWPVLSSIHSETHLGHKQLQYLVRTLPARRSRNVTTWSSWSYMKLFFPYWAISLLSALPACPRPTSSAKVNPQLSSLPRSWRNCGADAGSKGSFEGAQQIGWWWCWMMVPGTRGTVQGLKALPWGTEPFDLGRFFDMSWVGLWPGSVFFFKLRWACTLL